MAMTPAQLLAIAKDLKDRFPANAELVRNDVGNLALMVDGQYAGFVDLKFAELVIFADQD